MAESVEQSGRVYSAVCQRLRVYIAELHSLAEWQSLGRGGLESGQSGRVADSQRTRVADSQNGSARA